MKSLLSCLFLASSVMSYAAEANANPTDAAKGPSTASVEATGEAAIVPSVRDQVPTAEDRLRATEEAKKNALRAAVEQVAGMIVSAQTVTSNSALLSDKVFSHSQGYVRKYELVGQPTEERGVIKVTVKAEVGQADLDRDLQAVVALIDRLGHPRLVIVIQEQTLVDSKAGTATSSGVMAQVLTDAFKKDGWTILDPGMVSEKFQVSSGLGRAEPKDVDKSKVDYVLYGQVNFRNQEPPQMCGSACFPVSGEYELKLAKPGSNDQLVNVTGVLKPPPGSLREQLVSYEQTASNLARARGPEIVQQVRKAAIEALSNSEQNGNRVVMSVKGFSDHGAMRSFKRVLEEVTGVRNVSPRSLKDGKAEYDLVFAGTTEELAERLEIKINAKAKGNKKPLRVTGLTEDTMELSLLQ